MQNWIRKFWDLHLRYSWCPSPCSALREWTTRNVSDPKNVLVKVKENKPLRGDVLGYVAQMMARINAELGQSGRLWMEAS